MKKLLSMLLLAVLAVAPASFASNKNKKDDKKDEKKEMEYTAIISVDKADATEADVTTVKEALGKSKEFKCKVVTLEEKHLKATLSIEKGRLQKTAVTAALKDADKEKKYKVDKLDDVKPEKKDEKKDDKKDEKK